MANTVPSFGDAGQGSVDILKDQIGHALKGTLDGRGPFQSVGAKNYLPGFRLGAGDQPCDPSAQKRNRPLTPQCRATTMATGRRTSRYTGRRTACGGSCNRARTTRLLSPGSGGWPATLRCSSGRSRTPDESSLIRYVYVDLVMMGVCGSLCGQRTSPSWRGPLAGEALTPLRSSVHTSTFAATVAFVQDPTDHTWSSKAGRPRRPQPSGFLPGFSRSHRCHLLRRRAGPARPPMPKQDYE